MREAARLVVSDSHDGLRAAREATLPARHPPDARQFAQRSEQSAQSSAVSAAIAARRDSSFLAAMP